MAQHRFVAVVGARELPPSWAQQVEAVVQFFVRRGWGIGSGGARGADQYALAAVMAAGRVACARSVVFLPGTPRVGGTGVLPAFRAHGGRIVAGAGEGRAALLARSARLARESSGVVAFMWGVSRGSVFTVREAIRAGKPAAVVLAGGGAQLPAFPGGRWVACTMGPVAAHRWVADPEESHESAPKLTALGRVFVVPEGEPVQALMAHISSLSGGERLWFEHGVLAGDTVMVPHEALSDTPAFLALPRLMRQFRCSAREAAGLAELFLALDADPSVVAHYEGEAARRGAAGVIEDLVHLVARLALEEAPVTDAIHEAEHLGEWAESVAEDGGLASFPPAGDGESAVVGWHALGLVYAGWAVCPLCSERYEVDDESVEIPRCPACGTRDEWEARRGPFYYTLVAEIDACPSLAELAALGKRFYGLGLPHDQAGVAWTHYQLRRAALEAALALGPMARSLIARIETAPEGALARLGAQLYRTQRAGAAITPAEWRRVWCAYRARRPRAA